MDKFSELKATVPVNVKNREAVAAGFVTHDNTGGYFVIECQECGAVYPSQQADGGGQIADTGDYDDAICPHCGEESPEECENVGLAWNVQQAKITVLLAELEDERTSRELWQQNCTRAEERIAELEAQAKVWESAALKHLERAEAAEKRLATPVQLLGEMLLHDWEHSVERQATFQHRKIAWDARLAEDKKAILAAGFTFTFTVEGDE